MRHSTLIILLFFFLARSTHTKRIENEMDENIVGCLLWWDDLWSTYINLNERFKNEMLLVARRYLKLQMPHYFKSFQSSGVLNIILNKEKLLRITMTKRFAERSINIL